MFKELAFSIVIVILIFLGDSITNSYTEHCVDETSNKLIEICENINKKDEEIDAESVKDQIEDIHKEWNDKYEKVAFYLEHDELEKVETELNDIQARINTEEYKDAIPEIDKCIFILRHIKEKYAFNLKNIF